MNTVDQMLDNHEADSWRDLSDDTEFDFDNDRLSPLERLTEYVDYCFETYPIVYNNLIRDHVQTCVADWDRRRGMCKYHAWMGKREFGKQVRDSKWRDRVENHYAIFLSIPLIGVPPEEDKGVGWKPCVRHELGHAIDIEQRGTSGHDQAFKAVMSGFGEESNGGHSQHGYSPRVHR